jgi:hypothetical protein
MSLSRLGYGRTTPYEREKGAREQEREREREKERDDGGREK